MRFILIFVCFTAALFAEEELVVHLASEGPLPTLYVDTIDQDKSGFSKEYLLTLEKVLRFDIDKSGKAQLLSKASEYSTQTKKEKGLKVFDKAAWSAMHIDYVVKVSIDEKKLAATAFITQKGTFKGLENIVLTGNATEDRRKMHEVADAIIEALFGTKGVASSKILYTVRKRAGASSGEWHTDVWESDYDGSNARQITHDGFLCVTPAYIAKTGSARKFLYVSYKIGQPKIMIGATDGSEVKRLTLMRGNQLMPALSQKKDCIAFVSDITGNPELFIQPFSVEKGLLDKPRQVFAAKGGAQASPTFSPDGRKIAFVSNKDGAPRIYVIDVPAPGTALHDVKAHLISKQNKDNTCPAWSPDGTKIAYSASTKGVRQIWIYDFKTKRESQVTKGTGHKENPSWAPDSQHIVYNSGNATTSEIFMLNLAQKEAHQISQGPGEKRFPVWEY